MQLGHIIELHPTTEHYALFARAAGVARLAYNWGLARWVELYRAGLKPNWMSLQKEFVSRIDAEFPFCRAVPSTAYMQPFRHLGKAFDNFFRKIGDYPTFKATRLRSRCVDCEFQYRAQLGLDQRTAACAYFPAEQRDPKSGDPHVEFITPLRGPESERNSQPQRNELFAHLLRFVDLLLDDPITVTDPALGPVTIPHPLAYVIQKTRIRPKRRDAGMAAKDQADAYFLIVSLRAAWMEWRDRWARIMRHPEQGSWLRDTQRIWQELYQEREAPGAREVGSAYPDHPPAVASRVMREFQATFAAP